MSSTNTTKANGAKVATSKKTKNGTGKSTAKSTTNYELLPQEEASDNASPVSAPEKESSNVPEGTETATENVEMAAAKAKSKKAVAAKAKPKKVGAAASKSEPKKVAQKKAVSNVKNVGGGSKKIRLAASTYHYYRNWLAEFMRAHGVPSAKFQKSPESYNGHIMVLETEKAKGIKALDQWTKQNPDTKELFWDVKK